MSRRSVPLLLLILLALPGALAHGGVEDEDRYISPTRAPRVEPSLPQGYTGPGREPYVSYFEGVWLYGTMSASPVNGQRPVDMDVDGDWLVWEDLNRTDIFAYSISAGQGYYLNNDAAEQRAARISGNVVVYEDHRALVRSAVYAYFLDTGETRRLSAANRSARNPEIDYPIVTWIDENSTNPDVWAYSLLNNTAWNVHPGTDRDIDPVVVHERIFWRTYRYNLYDIQGYDTRTGEEIQVTTDSAIQSAPFTNGEDLLYLSNYYEMGWKVERFDLETEEFQTYDFYVPDSSHNKADGDAMLRTAMDVDYAQLVVRNLTSGATNHVSGNLVVTTAPVIQDHTVYASLRTREGVSILVLDVSPFAFSKPPALTIATPSDGAPWLRPLQVAGLLTAGPEWTEPTTFTYRVDDEAPQIVPPGQRWRFTLDPNGVEPGRHLITLRATFREGPPVSESIVLTIPAPSQTIDVERAGPAFHAARLMGELNAYVLSNPASWFLIPLLLILLVVACIRFWLWLKPRRKRVVAEYVAPDADY